MTAAHNESQQRAEPLRQLLSCPFCGGNGFSMQNYAQTVWQTSCTECHAGTPQCYETQDLAEAAWNTRASGDVRAAVIEALEWYAKDYDHALGCSQWDGGSKARAALAQPATDGAARREWQPIATAPKEEVLLYFPAKVVGAYAQSTLPKMMKVGRASDYPNRIPSHWMPLPAIPGGIA